MRAQVERGLVRRRSDDGLQPVADVELDLGNGVIV